jgi:hypothetical protein
MSPRTIINSDVISHFFHLLENNDCIKVIITMILVHFNNSNDELVKYFVIRAISENRLLVAKNLIKQCEKIGGLSAEYKIKVKTIFGLRRKNSPVELRVKHNEYLTDVWKILPAHINVEYLCPLYV